MSINFAEKQTIHMEYFFLTSNFRRSFRLTSKVIYLAELAVYSFRNRVYAH